MRHLPNLICLVRILLVWPIVMALQRGAYVPALALFVVASLSDGLDGFLAKRYGWTSDLGRVLDPIADKLLLVAVFVAATWAGLVPWWLTAAAIARDLLLGVGALTYRIWFGPFHGRPSAISKLNTLLQMLVLCSALLGAAFAVPPTEVTYALAALALCTTLASGADYVHRCFGQAWRLPVGEA